MDSQVAVGLTTQETLSVLTKGEVIGGQRIPWGSNNTFLVHVDAGDSQHVQAVYKPGAGEQPLHDFPWQTLYKREYAAYLLAESLGWPRIPMTVIRDGPAGVGSMQLYVECDPNVTYFDLVADRLDILAEFATFDILTNNADRKAGHCLLGGDNTIWSIDHGLTFHAEFKVRTIMLEFWGQPIPDEHLEAVKGVRDELATNGEFTANLRELLAEDEFDALRQRVDEVLAGPTIPQLDPGYNIPWPLV
jgi:uncharacterized repeat protein (TIGR03843 family)